MFRKDLLEIVRPRPWETEGPFFAGGIEADGAIFSGTVRSPASGEAYRVRDGYLDLLQGRIGGDNIANLTNLLPGAGRSYEPLWRVRSLTLLTGERFPNDREIGIIRDLVGLDRGGRHLDLGCSAGLYARNLAHTLGANGEVMGVDISPSMLKQAARQVQAALGTGANVSLVRADAKQLPFADASFAGVVCGGTLNELGDPARALGEANRVLEPGGRIAIMGILRATTTGGRRLHSFLGTGGLKFFAPEEVEDLLTGTGFVPDPLQIYGSVFFAGATR